MKHFTLAAILLLSFVVAAYSQQANGRRRGLDQLDLLSLPSSTTSGSAAPIIVDLQTFQLLEPLVRYCRELEALYKTEVLDKPGPLTPAGFDSVFRQRGIAIHRSILLIRKTPDVAPQVSKLLDQTDEFGKDASMVIISAQFPDDEDAKKEMANVRKKYNAADSMEPKIVIGVILSRMNANFARLRLVE